MSTKQNEKAKTNEEPKVAAGAVDSEIMYEAPKDAGAVAETFLYRPGKQKEPGTFKDKKGNTKAHCGTAGIKGYPYATEDRESDYSEDGMKLVKIYTTAPTLGIQNEEVKKVPVGSILLVIEKADLRQKKLSQYAEHPTTVTECYLQPTGQTVPTPKGEMETWTIQPILKDGVPVQIPRTKLKVNVMPALPPRPVGEVPSELVS